MAIPTIGQGAAVLPPLALAVLAAGPYVLPGSAVIIVGWLLCATQLAPRLMNGVLRLSGTTVFVAGSIGPTKKQLSMGIHVEDPGRRDVTFDEMVARLGS